MHIIEATAAITDRLTAAGIEAADDARSLNLPGVLVSLQAIEAETLKRTHTVSLEVALIAPGGLPAMDTLEVLGELHDHAESALEDIASLGRVEAQALILPNHSPDPLPALVAHVDLITTP